MCNPLGPDNGFFSHDETLGSLIFRRQGHPGEFNIPQQDGQYVIEVMSDAAGQDADGLQFLDFLQLFFGSFAPGNVTKDALNRDDLTLLHPGVGVAFQDNFFPTFVKELGLDIH
ncbi:MAG: hypothetical protein P8Y63_16205, partial [Deltaproteobacteria bacterium]